MHESFWRHNCVISTAHEYSSPKTLFFWYGYAHVNFRCFKNKSLYQNSSFMLSLMLHNGLRFQKFHLLIPRDDSKFNWTPNETIILKWQFYDFNLIILVHFFLNPSKKKVITVRIFCVL
jgi:hypothetical protein